MIRWIGTVLFLMMPAMLLARPVAVQTGEHDDFTRVVLTIPTGVEWALGRDQQGYVLRLPVAEGYQLDRFFELIPRNRITDVSQMPEAGELRLVVSCDCNADAFLFRPDILVIDIRDGLPTDDAPFEVALDAPAILSPPAIAPAAIVPVYQPPRDRLLPLVVPDVIAEPDQIAMPSLDESPQDQVSAGTDFADSEMPETLLQDLAALEQSITQSLGRGLTQGVLAPELPTANDVMTDEAISQALRLMGVQAPGLRTSTSIDRAAIPEDPPTIVTQRGESCAPASYFDVGTWGDDRPFSEQISEARGKLTGEFDKLDEAAVVALARRFVYFGFGREAIQSLSLDGAMSQERRYLTAVAQIIDGDPHDLGLFEQQVSCAAPVALWAMLANGDHALDAQIDRPSVLRAFKALPPGLQTHLGPRLAERFVAIGDNDGASQALAGALGESAPTIEATLAETALDRALGDPLGAVETLSEIASTDVRMTPEAMTELFIESIKNDVVLSDSDFLLADAMRFENAELPAAADLALAQASAYLHLDRFTASRAVIVDEGDNIDPARRAAFEDTYAQAATQRMSDLDFLSYAFGDDISSTLPLTQHAMAERLLVLGFPDRAVQVVATDLTDVDLQAERRYLRARAALAKGDTTAAIAALDGLETEASDRLRQIADDLQSANLIFADDMIASDTATSQWRRGDWQDLARSEDSLLQAASATVLGNQTATSDPDTPLASGRALIAQSSESRAVLNDLLTRFAAPDEF